MRTFTIAALAVAATAAGQQDFRPTTDVTVEAKRERLERASGSAASLLRGTFGGDEESGDIPGCVYGDSFDSYLEPGGYGPLAGEENFDGGVWMPGAGEAWSGAVNNDAAQSRPPMYAGPKGGPDPMGVRGGMLSFQRASYGSAPVAPPNGRFEYVSDTDLYVSTSADPLFVTLDFYKPSHGTFQWWDPASGFEGLLLARMLFGGFFEEGTIGMLADAFGSPDVNEGVIVLGPPLLGSATLPIFYASPHVIPERGWFTAGVLVSPEGYSLWIRDATTLADDLNTDDGPDYKTPVRTDGPFAGQRMFAEFGYGLEEGWVQVWPGFEDDPSTADVIEGDGLAVGRFGTPLVLTDTNGNSVGRIPAATSVDSPYELAYGLDPSEKQLPGYEIEDWWVDNLCLRGQRFRSASPPDWVYPYVEDFERYAPGYVDLQNDRWVVGEGLFPEIVVGGTTPGDGSDEDGLPADRALRDANVTANGVWRTALWTRVPSTLRLEAAAGDPVSFSAQVKFEERSGHEDGDFETSRSVELIDNDLYGPVDAQREPMAFVLFGAVDEAGVSDGLVYVRQRREVGSGAGMYDPSEADESALLPGPHARPSLSAPLNVPSENVLAAPAGQASMAVPLDSFNELRVEVEPTAAREPTSGAQVGTVRVFLGGVELFPDGDDGRSWTTAALTMDEVAFGSGNNAAGLLERLTVDDINIDGPVRARPLAGVVEDPGGGYGDDAPFALPFVEGFETYDLDPAPVAGQGATDRFGAFEPVQAPDVNEQDWQRHELATDAPALDEGDPVAVYDVMSVDGAGPLSEGDRVAVDLRGFPVERDGTLPRFGGTTQDTAFAVVDGSGSAVQTGEWRLVAPLEDAPGAPTAPEAFDGGTMVDAGLRYRFEFGRRFDADARADNETRIVDAMSEGVDPTGEHGAALRFENTGGAPPADAVNAFDARVPTILSESDGDAITLSVDLYVDADDPRTGWYVEFAGVPGEGPGGLITHVSLGGEGFVSGNPDPETGVEPTLARGNFGLLVENPAPGAGLPENVYEDTGVDVPLNAWFELELTLRGDSTYSAAIKRSGGRTTLSAPGSGVAVDADDPDLITSGVDTVRVARNNVGVGDGGALSFGEVRWSARGPDAVAEVFGGQDVWHFFSVTDFDETADEEVYPGVPDPDIDGMVRWVDMDTGAPLVDMMGAPLPPRRLLSSDVIAVRNLNPETGLPFDRQPVLERWRLVDSARGGAARAAGDWRGLGLPAQGGIHPIPPGGIANPQPAYNGEAPFVEIVLADYESIEPPVPAARERLYVDDVRASVVREPACPADLTGDEMVDATDLGVLIAGWGSPAGKPDADFTGDGNVDATDLGVLLAAWGPCDG